MFFNKIELGYNPVIIPPNAP